MYRLNTMVSTGVGLAALVLGSAMAVPVLGQATTAYITLEVNGSSTVLWDDIKDGFVMDIIVGSNDPSGMCAFGVVLDGDPSFSYAAVTAANYDAAQGWDGVSGHRPDAGNLPMHHAVDEYIATIYSFSWAQNGRAAWVEFTSVPPKDEYVITTNDAYVGDSTFAGLYLGDPGFTFTPLTILPEPTPFLLPLDILPHDDPNLFTVQTKENPHEEETRRLPMAILGSEEHPAADIDPDSISIADVVFPVKTPSTDKDENGDGANDLVIHVARRDLIQALGLDAMDPGTEVSITVKGALLDGTPFEATDSIVLVERE